MMISNEFLEVGVTINRFGVYLGQQFNQMTIDLIVLFSFAILIRCRQATRRWWSRGGNSESADGLLVVSLLIKSEGPLGNAKFSVTVDDTV